MELLVNRKQPIAADGRWLADWLNRGMGKARPGNNPAARIHAFLAVRQFNRPLYRHSARIGSRKLYRQPPTRSTSRPDPVFEEIPCSVVARFTATGGPDEQSVFELVPGNDGTRALLIVGRLENEGEIKRLKLCPNPKCNKSWYWASRSDQKACSPKCKQAVWQKTTRGKETKKVYMREYRATRRRLGLD